MQADQGMPGNTLIALQSISLITCLLDQLCSSVLNRIFQFNGTGY